MIVSFDENVQERDCTVLFEFNSEFDICVAVNFIEVAQKLGCCVFIAEQSEDIVEQNRGASVVVKDPLLASKWHKDVSQNRT